MSVILWRIEIDSGGLQPGDIIASINGEAVKHSEDVYRCLEGNGQQMDVMVVRKRQKMTFKISPEEVS